MSHGDEALTGNRDRLFADHKGRAVLASAGIAILAALVIYEGPIKSVAHRRAEIAEEVGGSYATFRLQYGVPTNDKLPFVVHGSGINKQYATINPLNSQAIADPGLKKNAFTVLNVGSNNLALQADIQRNMEVTDIDTSNNQNSIVGKAVIGVCDASPATISNISEWNATITQLEHPAQLSSACIAAMQLAITQTPSSTLPASSTHSS